MSNANTFAAVRGLALGNVTSTSAFPTVSGGSTRAICAVRADVSGGLFDGVPFQVKAVFKAVPGTSGNFTGSIYWDSNANTDLTTTTGDKIFVTSGTIALGTQAASYLVLAATLIWDSTATRLAGINDPQCFHTIAVPAVLFSGASAVTATNNPVSTSVANAGLLRFYATALFGTSNSANAATLVELAINQL